MALATHQKPSERACAHLYYEAKIYYDFSVCFCCCFCYFFLCRKATRHIPFIFFFEFFLSDSPRIKICHFTYVNRLIYIFFFFFVSVILLWCDEQASHIPLYVQKQRKQQSKLAVHLRKITFYVRGRHRKSAIAHTVPTY